VGDKYKGKLASSWEKNVTLALKKLVATNELVSRAARTLALPPRGRASRTRAAR
jgi:hypothetical protein